MKKRKDGDKSEDSVGGDLEEIKKKKAKKVKKVSFDNVSWTESFVSAHNY